MRTNDWTLDWTHARGHQSSLQVISHPICQGMCHAGLTLCQPYVCAWVSLSLSVAASAQVYLLQARGPTATGLNPDPPAEAFEPRIP